MDLSQGHPNNEKSGLFLYLNTNKYGVTLTRPTRRQGSFSQINQRCRRFRPELSLGCRQEAGLDYESLRRLIRSCHDFFIPYGLTGPYKDWKAYDINICALGGITAASGYPEREPLVRRSASRILIRAHRPLWWP